jgi:hypothetical protein
MHCRERALLERASSETGMPQPQTLAGWAELIDAWVEISTTFSAMTPAVYELDLPAVCEAMAPAGRGGVGRLWAVLTSARYRATRAKLRSALLRGRKLGDHDLYSCVVAARDSAASGPPMAGEESRVPRAPSPNARRPTSTCSVSSPSWRHGQGSPAWPRCRLRTASGYWTGWMPSGRP